MRRPLLISLLFFVATGGQAEDLITREYRMKHADAAIIIQVLNVSVTNTSKKRILSGAGKRLIVTDIYDKQDEIAEILPVIDQPSKYTEPKKIHMEMVVRASRYLQERKRALKLAQSPGPVPGSKSAGEPTDNSSPIRTYDVRRSSMAYKSVYSDEDAKLMRKPRVYRDDPVLPNLSSLTLKGIFRETSGKPLAILFYGGVNFTARDGLLYAPNHTLMKGITSQIKKNSVLLTGPDRIPREIKFHTTL
jgi:hypothetical protein